MLRSQTTKRRKSRASTASSAASVSAARIEGVSRKSTSRNSTRRASEAPADCPESRRRTRGGAKDIDALPRLLQRASAGNRRRLLRGDGLALPAGLEPILALLRRTAAVPAGLRLEPAGERE